MALQIVNAGERSEDVTDQIRTRIEAAIEGAEVEVKSGGPGHYEIHVTSAAFEGKRRVAQQQLVYAAIGELMSGQNAPVHAVDRLVCSVP